MQTEKNIWLRMLTMILILALLISCVPSQVYALAGETLTDIMGTNDLVDLQSNAVLNSVPGDVQIIAEDENKRGEMYKEYILSNGLRLATVYTSAIHYEVNGKWEDIDNSLLAAISDEKAVYQNAAGAWNIQFPQSLSGNDMISIAKDGYTVRFGMAGELRSGSDLAVASAGSIEQNETVGTVEISSVQTAIAQIQQFDLTAAIEEAEYAETVLDKLHSRLSYSNIYPNTNVVYDLQGNQLKESVVLQQYDASLWGYRYTLDTGDLVPMLRDDLRIDLCNPNTNEVVLTMPAPYMQDNNGEISYAVDVSLIPTGSKYLLSYYLPREWLADEYRAWPVILDPVIEFTGIYSNVDDITVAKNYNEDMGRGVIQCGYSSKAGAMRFYMQFLQLPTMTSADVIVDAKIRLNKPYDSGTTANVSVHKVTEEWSQSAISWTNQPSFETNIEDYVVCQLAGHYTWNITDIVRDWYETGNYGMVFKVPSEIETAGVDNWKQFYSSDFNYSSNDVPFLTITYQNYNGLENYWDYTSVYAGRAGTGYVQNYSGNLVWVHSDMGFDGNRMPVSISHVYSANDADSNRFGLGNGWRTNYHQIITQAQDDNGTPYYVWEDGDGTAHDFFADSAGVYKDSDDLGLVLTTTTTGYTITDKYDNTSNFDTSGRLISQVNNQATTSRILISYEAENNLRIKEILDGVERKYIFSYENGLLSQIDFFGKGTSTLFNIQYAYTNSNLTTITYNDGTSASFTYSAKNILLTATDIDGYKVSFGYNTLETSEPSRVVSISESDDGVAGASTTLQYTYRCTHLTDHNGDTQTIFFNEWGNTISIQDSEGQAVFYQYDTDVHENGVKNRLLAVSKEQSTTVNLLEDASFENGTVWPEYSSNYIDCSTTTTYSYDGTYSLKSDCSNVYGTIGGYCGTFRVAVGVTYTFSAYMKTVGGQASLRIMDDTGTYIDSISLASGTDWTRLETSYTNSTSDARTITVCVYHVTPGTAYIDCVQLEKNAVATRYNNITDSDILGSLTSTDSAWTIYSESTKTPTNSPGAPAAPLTGNRICISGDPEARQYVYQTVNISGEIGDSYVFSGWTMGDSLPDIGGDRFHGLVLVFNNTDGTKTEVAISANTNLGNSGQWQYLVAPAIADKAYNSITLRAEFSYNANIVYFDGLQLYKEEFGESYTYDTNGNVTAVRNILGQTTTYSYNNSNDVIKVVSPSGVTTTYTVSNHNVTGSLERYTYPNGTFTNLASYTYVYDSYGNQTQQAATINGVVKITSATYSSDKNHLTATVDELGNTTTYDYNLNTSVLESIYYPKDTDVTCTKYTYDSMYRLVGSSTTTEQGQEMSASYTYVDDVLTTIATKSTTYSIAYGDFALRTKVSIGSRTLASYTYSDVENKYLATLEHGNLDMVKYTYDDLGRVIQEAYYENGSSIISRTISYQYDNMGALATTVDSKTGVTTRYYYDTIGRSSGMYESGGSSTHRLTYAYDDQGRLQISKEICGSTTYTTEYSYYNNGQIYQIEVGNSTELYTYDAYGRLDQWYTYHGSSSNYLIRKNIHYEQPDERTTSSWPSVWTYTSTGGYSLIFNYGYDANGNIISAKVDGKTTTYVYDSANQLIRENNEAMGKTWVWTYDDAGNILTKKEYAYTTGTLGSVVDTITYTYGNANWGDLLTKYDGVTISYDSIGNPLSDGTWTYTWQQGRNLATMSNGSTTWTYTYDANGMRTKRTTGSTTYTYTYNGSQLTHMTYGSTALHFYYDASGSPLSVTYGGATYYYVLNLQGDVVAILNSSGVQVVGYTYDAWGNPLLIDDDSDNNLGILNPLRYRGYVYDTETGLYYLQSRYYNPTWGRFLNVDNYPSTGQGLLGNNMFAYCGNNPVSRADSNGQFWHLVVGGVIGGIIGAVSSAASGGDVVDVLIGAAAGAAGGVLAASGAGVVVQALGSAAISMASNAASQVNHIVKDETGETAFNVGDMLFDGVVGLACGAWGGNGASYGNSGGITAAGKQLFKRGFFNPQARSYYAKVAHNMGGEYVFKPLLQSLGKSAVGSTIVTGKNILFN